MKIGDTYLYKHITIVKSTGDCPVPDYVCGVLNDEQALPFLWLEEDELQQECIDPIVVDIVEAPDWMTTEEMRSWVLSMPQSLEEYFDEDWIFHQDRVSLQAPKTWDDDLN